MGRVLYTIVILTIVWSCNFSSSKEKDSTNSLNYSPPTPGKLDPESFRNYNRSLSSLMDSSLLRSGFNGAILIAKDGEVLYEKYVGYAHLQKKDSVTDSTAFHLASVSKPFTGVGVLKMVQENKLSLDDSLQQFFPGFPYHVVTIKMLLNHRSGIPNYVYFMANSKWDKNVYVTNQDVLNFIFSDQPKLSFTPGTRFSYSNTNYVLLAMIIEKLSGKPFPVYMKENLFDPLQMHHTYVYTYADSAKSIPSFNYNNSLWQNDFLDITYGDKNTYSTPRDILKWDQALYTGQVVRLSLLDTAFTPYSNERPSVHNYGLGFRLLLLPNGKKVIYHFGRWHGFNAAFARLPEEKATIIILGNKFNRNIYYTAIKTYNRFGSYDRWKQEEDSETDENGGRK
ncbi:MAG TPA: serine hydrolase domain-containing protein [Chitinophagaceae bacterium]